MYYMSLPFHTVIFFPPASPEAGGSMKPITPDVNPPPTYRP